MQETTGADVTVTVWWTPPCGYLHVERNPTALHLDRCPDGHERDPLAG